MLLHLRPRLFSVLRNIALVDFAINPLGLLLRGDADLATSRPYPNKQYVVACRRQGRKAIDGILIETPQPVRKLCTTTRWAIEAGFIVTHRVTYELLDEDFDAASDSMLLWYACSNSLGSWSSRWPTWAMGKTPVSCEPQMEIVPHNENARRALDIVDGRGLIVERSETFRMPTIERERIIDSKFPGHRLPAIASAFRQS